MICEPRPAHSTAWMATFLLVLACNRGEGEGTTAEARRREPQPISRRECGGGSTQKVDVNNDGRPDITHHLDGSKRACSEVDMNFDGKPDLVRFYEDDGRAISFEQHDFDFDGRLDSQAYYKAAKVERKELDTNFDGLVDTWMWCNGALVDKAERARRKPGRVDTWETYQNGLLSEVKFDENNDGTVEKWDTYRQGALYETRLDTNGDGKADRTDRAESGGSDTDERVSCDGSPLPPEQPSFPAGTGGTTIGGSPAGYGGDAGMRAVGDAGVTPSTDQGLRGAARVDASVGRALATGTSSPEAGPLLRTAADAGAGGAVR